VEYSLTFFILLTAYFLGSIPFGLIITRAAGLGDIRKVGSGNIGATNVMRTGRKFLGINTLILDAVKGMLAVELAKHMELDPLWIYASAMAAVLGHVFPVWLKFKGGKGVATALGVTFALNPMIGFTFCAFWLIAFLITRYVSVASIEALWACLLIPLIHLDIAGIIFYALLAGLITWTHRGNIKRIREGTESSFFKKKDNA
jgi:acyl phosphate:glycerol-3-phosphate acyltransferase